MSHFNFCLPVIKNSKEEALITLKESHQKYSFFEIWLDSIKDFDLNFLATLLSSHDRRFVFRFAREKLPSMPIEKRLEIIDQLHNSTGLIDLDIELESAEISHIKEAKLKVKTILSIHNFKETPETSQLRDYYSKMMEMDADIFKFACYCNSKQDALRLLSFQLELAKSGTRHIVLGMGEEGVITRIFGSLWGNELVFAPLTSEEASAPGQLSYHLMKSILESLTDPKTIV